MVPRAARFEDVELAGEPDLLICSYHARPALNLDPIAVLHLELIFEPDVEERADE